MSKRAIPRWIVPTSLIGAGGLFGGAVPVAQSILIARGAGVNVAIVMPPEVLLLISVSGIASLGGFIGWLVWWLALRQRPRARAR
jgi:hypothetical protein